jgi:hypothetical protein
VILAAAGALAYMTLRGDALGIALMASDATLDDASRYAGVAIALAAYSVGRITQGSKLYTIFVDAKVAANNTLVHATRTAAVDSLVELVVIDCPSCFASLACPNDSHVCCLHEQ